MNTPQLATFDFNLLRTLNVLLRERSVTRSAKELNLTQQAVSGSLKRLREQFNDPLLIRIGQRLEATPLALALVTPVRDALRQIALTLEAAPVFNSEATKRRFRIAMSDHSSLTLLPRLVSGVARLAPGITYEVVPVNRRAVYELDLGDLDFLVMPQGHGDQPHLSQRISSLSLFHDHFVCVADRNNPVARNDVSLSEYAEMQHVALLVDEGFKSIVEGNWLRAGLRPKVAITVSGFAEMVCVVQGTGLVATVHNSLARMFEGMLPIKVFSCPLGMPDTVQQLNWHSMNDNDPTHCFMRNAFLSASRSYQIALSDPAKQ